MKRMKGDRLRDLEFVGKIGRYALEGMQDLKHNAMVEVAKVGLAIHSDKTKIMLVGKWNETDRIMTDDKEDGFVDDS